METNKLGIKSLFVMILLTGVTVSIAIILTNIVVAFFIYFKGGQLPLNWHDDVFLAIYRGSIVGAVAGFGLWVMAKIQGK